MAGKKRYKEFADYPTYKQMYILTFDKMIAKRKKRKESNWKTGEDVFRWWMEEDSKNVKGQLNFEFEELE